MSRTRRFFRDVLSVWVLLTLAAGCAGLDLREQSVAPGGCNNVTQKRRQRSAEVVREFDCKRDRAEFQAAAAHWDRGDGDACKEGLRRLLERNSDHRDARLLMAEVYLSENRTQEAFNQIEHALRAHPHDARVQFATGVLLDATGQGNSALAYYQRAAELEPDNELYAVGNQTALRPADGTSVMSHRGQAEPTGPSSAYADGHPDDSSRTSAKPALVVPDPTARRWAVWPSALTPHRAVEPAQAIPADRVPRSKTAAPGDNMPQPRMAPRTDLRTETPDRADPTDPGDSAETAAVGRVRSLLDRGREALAEGSAEAAMAQFRKAAGICPDNPQIPITAATAALRHNRPELAIELLRGAERRFSGSARLYRVLGLSYYRLGDYRSSQVALRQALSLDKSSALSYLLMGCTLSKLGQFESAEAHLRQARAIDPRYTVRR